MLYQAQVRRGCVIAHPDYSGPALLMVQLASDLPSQSGNETPAASGVVPHTSAATDVIAAVRGCIGSVTVCLHTG